jgi:hypothetical protein
MTDSKSVQKGKQGSLEIDPDPRIFISGIGGKIQTA